MLPESHNFLSASPAQTSLSPHVHGISSVLAEYYAYGARVPFLCTSTYRTGDISINEREFAN